MKCEEWRCPYKGLLTSETIQGVFFYAVQCEGVPTKMYRTCGGVPTKVYQHKAEVFSLKGVKTPCGLRPAAPAELASAMWGSNVLGSEGLAGLKDFLRSVCELCIKNSLIWRIWDFWTSEPQSEFQKY